MIDPTPAVAHPPRVKGVVTLQRPHDGDYLNLLRLWELKRGARLMPSRADFDPAELTTLLPDIFLVDVLPPPAHYRFRLMGENVVSFHGGNFSGKTFLECFEPRSAALLIALFDSVVEGRAPIFRTGEAYWWSDKKYSAFECCYFPLSADGRDVNMVIGAMRFPMRH